MLKNKMDKYIREKVKQDNKIPLKAEEIIKNFEGVIPVKENKGKIIKFSLKTSLAIAASVVIVAFLGANMYANHLGKPNVISAIQAFIEDNKKKEEVGQNEIIEENNLDENIENEKDKSEPVDGVKISMDEAYKIARKKYNSGLIEISYTSNNLTVDGVEYYAFRRLEVVNGKSKYLSTILVSLDGTVVKETFQPNTAIMGTEAKEYTQEEIEEMQEDQYNEIAKVAVQKFLDIQGLDIPSKILISQGLTTKEELESAMMSKEPIIENYIEYKNTNISYSAFKNKMLQVMTENMFNKFIYVNRDLIYKNVDGILWTNNYSNESTIYVVSNLELFKKEGNYYTYFVEYTINGDSTKAYKEIVVEIQNEVAKVESWGN